MVRHQRHAATSLLGGFWTPWKGARGSMKTPAGRRARTVRLLTCEANSVVKPIHPKAMSIILTEPEEIELRLTADWKDAKALQRPFPAEAVTLLRVGQQTEAGQQATLF
ncbi:SOS response-associated peptidase family protein [Sinorhizobium meliloti]|uniref:SOS response-associated peptidase family protein n=1 Tax=Sinorhizobium TaxID=28105 RepID=UPI00398CA6F2